MSDTTARATGARQESRPVHESLPIQDLIQVRVGRLQEIINQLARHSVGARGLRSTDLRILNILYDADAVSINELARRAHVDKAWISRSVVQLLEKKLISKQRDPRDSRAQLVRLTPKARRLLDQVRPQVQSNERFLLQGLDEVAFKRQMDMLMDNAVALLEQHYKVQGKGKAAGRKTAPKRR